MGQVAEAWSMACSTGKICTQITTRWFKLEINSQGLQALLGLDAAAALHSEVPYMGECQTSVWAQPAEAWLMDCLTLGSVLRLEQDSSWCSCSNGRPGYCCCPASQACQNGNLILAQGTVNTHKHAKIRIHEVSLLCFRSWIRSKTWNEFPEFMHSSAGFQMWIHKF